MSLISIRRLKLFKKHIPSLSDKTTSNHEILRKAKFTKQLIFSLWRQPFIFLFIFVLIIAYFLSYTPSRRLPLLKPGDIAQADIISPIDLTVEDSETTQKRREEAEKSVLPVYTLDLNTFLNTEDKLRMFFSLGRDWSKTPPQTALSVKEFASILVQKTGIELDEKELELWRKTGFPPEMEISLSDSLRRVFERGILRSKALFLRGENEKGFIISEEIKPERLVRVQDVLDLKEARNLLVQEIQKLSLPLRQRQLLADLGSLLISPNLSFNRVETDKRKEEAKARVETVYYRIKKGKVIIRKGDEATTETVKLITLINQNLELRSGWGKNFIAHFFLFGLLLISVWFYLKSLFPFDLALNRFLLIGTLLILSLFLNKLALSLATIFSENARQPFLTEVSSYSFAFPNQLGPLILTFLTGSHLALVLAILNSLLAGFLLQADFYLMLYVFIASLAAIYGVKFYGTHNRASTLRAGFLIVVPINIFLSIIIYLIRAPSGLSLEPLGLVIMAIIGGWLSGTLAFLLLPLFEKVFQILTKARLIELTNSDLPIFRQMALEAPGSYHHSLIVSTLAEKAAEAIKVDPLLVKAGALYHDIGKIKRPEYFIENVSRNPSAHEDLNPQLSALVIINHVKDGVDLARKLRLPEKIKELIAQHHGSSLVRYFYEKAKEKYDPELHRVGEETYRYPGPPPQNKEAALILLADSVEAASRSLTSHDRETLKRMINEILESYIEDGQLDECDLTLKDLHQIANSFLETLDTIYHPRLKYPSFDFEGIKKQKERRKRANYGSNHQSAKKA
ncbi:MAG: HDIG domain-containing protein [Candidatus Aminicenantes bacterium]|nr:HDIG domain-containing protein [Candidatus Aminicenantes bacterium]